MNNSTPTAIYRADYRPPGYTIETVHLEFELDASATHVRSAMQVQRSGASSDLVLNGSDLGLVAVRMDGRTLSASEYTLEPAAEPDTLTIHGVPEHASIEIETQIDPASNTVLEGLYLSSGNYCTQCEAEGFRRITWYPDRPDVMARFTVKITADKTHCPVLLCNGNQTDNGDLDDGRHWVLWEDPWPKPSYLFALVAGDLAHLNESFTTASGRVVDLAIYVEPHNIDKCDHAMASLRTAMRWDEERFGLEYDLERYMIVAVDDFNMGAMENKGLNVFNSRYVLADQATATDSDFLGIESVVAHEYFHNWSGNRVTCRDWFQLSLKEGLTVFRDQEFSADQHSRAVKRIEDVRVLRARQFPEDAGPMAHPVRPDSYIEINNFYTMTIYEKGAEVIRMMHTILGPDRFRAGIDLYFKRHDGQAVTCEDFVLCMEAASQVDLRQFRLWYSQSGTPRLEVNDHYDAEQQRYTLTVKQSLLPTREQPNPAPMHIPLSVSLLSRKGQPLPITVSNAATTEVPKEGKTVAVLHLTEAEQHIEFNDVTARPVPSLLRGFSAPVILNYTYSLEDLAFLLTHETDSFNRWEAGQRLLTRVIEKADDTHLTPAIDALGSVLVDSNIDSAYRAELLRLPTIEAIAEQHEVFDVDRLDASRQLVQMRIASALEEKFAAWTDNDSVFAVDTASIGRRTLVNVALEYLARLDGRWLSHLRQRFEQADNMTDQLASLRLLLDFDQASGDEYLQAFYRRWRAEKLVIDKWFSIQATARMPDVIERVEGLLTHDEFNLRNPNRVRALLGAFSVGNPLAFHRVDGRGYRLLAEQILQLDDINPQVAARLTEPLTRWYRMSVDRQQHIKLSLQLIAGKKSLSKDVFEVVNRALDR